MSALLDGFARAAQPRSYRIMPLAESAQLSVTEWNQVYWQEILFRAHFGASAGLLRLHEWLQGARRAQADGNVLMLAAGIRGFLEAAADTWKGFGDVAPTLADCHTVIRKAIKGELVEGALAPTLESSLIHFAYARKLASGDGPALHSAATARATVEQLLESAPDVLRVYATLCEYSHPAASSVFRFAGDISHADTLTFDPQAGSAKVVEILALSKTVGQTALVVGVAPLVLTLKVLNAFRFVPVATPWADTLSLGFSDVWRTLEARLRDPSGPSTASAQEQQHLIAELHAQYEPFSKKKRDSRS